MHHALLLLAFLTGEAALRGPVRRPRRGGARGTPHARCHDPQIRSTAAVSLPRTISPTHAPLPRAPAQSAASRVLRPPPPPPFTATPATTVGGAVGDAAGRGGLVPHEGLPMVAGGGALRCATTRHLDLQSGAPPTPRLPHSGVPPYPPTTPSLSASGGDAACGGSRHCAAARRRLGLRALLRLERGARAHAIGRVQPWTGTRGPRGLQGACHSLTHSRRCAP